MSPSPLHQAGCRPPRSIPRARATRPDRCPHPPLHIFTTGPVKRFSSKQLDGWALWMRDSIDDTAPAKPTNRPDLPKRFKALIPFALPVRSFETIADSPQRSWRPGSHFRSLDEQAVNLIPGRIGLRMPFDGNELITLDRFNRAVAG
jgi:hypothetical protein